MPKLIIITDLDGTLLDTRDYSCKACLPVVRRIKSQNIPRFYVPARLVLRSSRSGRI
jgi:hydroxymethylpyrimidine pyrophosphatase-like HAD family hydrolase